MTPFGIVVVVISSAAPGLTVMASPAWLSDAGGTAESVTRAVNVEVAAAQTKLGVPAMTPVAATGSAMPAGIEPAVRVQPTYGGVPPRACSVWLYAVPAVASGNDVVATSSATEMLWAWVAVNCGEVASVTLTVRFWLVAVAVAGPVMAPVVAFNAKPAGQCARADTEAVWRRAARSP